jgi:hypothetical protein
MEKILPIVDPPLPRPRILLDSGAFSAWNKKLEVDFQAYIDFALQYHDVVEGIVVLDSIPGSFGETRLTPAQVRKSAEKSWKNFQIMLEAGIDREKLIPVFHQNEEDEFLQMMIDEAPYFGLSPANDRSTVEKMKWLDRCMRLATDEKGMPRNKWHGFAVTAVRLMLRYPWYSVDSASWRISAAYGKILVVLKADPLIVGFYDISSKVTYKEGHVDQFSPRVKKLFQDHVESKGFCYQKLRDDAIYRSLWNATSYFDLQQLIPEWPWAFQGKAVGMGVV